MTGGVVCIGAAHVDRIARCHGEFARGASNPVTIDEAPGGVAHNVAANLALLGRRVALVSALGRDAEGDTLVEGLANRGIEVGAVVRCAEHPTASYTAILDRGGELVAGLSEGAIYDALDPTLVADLGNRFADWPTWVVDANLPAESLAALAAARRVFACAVSPAKAGRLRPCLGRLEALFANRSEAAVLSGRMVESEDALAACHALREGGPGAAYVTLGSRGVAAAAAEASAVWPALPSAVRDVNGAGDAFAAGAIDGLLRGAALTDTVARGLAMASLAVECNGPVPPALDLEVLAARAARAEARE